MASGPLISIVDDDRSAREAVAGMVRSLGYAVEEFSSAADFLEAGWPARTGCLIVDLRMPGMSGPELCRELTAQGRQVPAILVTAYVDEAHLAGPWRDGVVRCLRKPLQSDDLLAAIAAATGEPPGERR